MKTQIITFEGFELTPHQRRLVRDGKPVRIGSRAFDILVVLADNAGSIVTKEQLILSVWPNTFVDDNNLRVHMSALRRTLHKASNGHPIIENVPGRGYCFVATVDEEGHEEARSVLPSTTPPPVSTERQELLGLIEQLGRNKADRSRVHILDLEAIPPGGTLDQALRSTVMLLREGRSAEEGLSRNRPTLLALLAIL